MSERRRPSVAGDACDLVEPDVVIVVDGLGFQPCISNPLWQGWYDAVLVRGEDVVDVVDVPALEKSHASVLQ